MHAVPFQDDYYKEDAELTGPFIPLDELSTEDFSYANDPFLESVGS